MSVEAFMALTCFVLGSIVMLNDIIEDFDWHKALTFIAILAFTLWSAS